MGVLVIFETLEIRYRFRTSGGGWLCRLNGRGLIIVCVCVMHGSAVGKRLRFPFENAFDAGPQEISNVSIQKNKIHENEDSARRVDNDAELKEII